MTKFEIQNKIYIYSTFALDAQPPQYPILPMSRMYIYIYIKIITKITATNYKRSNEN